MATTTFSKEEKAAIKAAVAEKKAAQEGADAAAACDAAIAAMTGTDRELAEAFHQLVAENTSLNAKTWYGMPAYTDADGKVVVAFKPGSKFKIRYATLEFQQAANLDDGNLWPVGFALTKLDAAEKKRVADILKAAVGS
ncbi:MULTISPECIES: hypothetical protein [unclassified Leifsonia]|uniref:hypothetical protein n=1 Tax=unclassified Leifsonia TaxID=2663824 RepID=UPI0008A7AE8F|nr:MULTISPECIES: hypothetical protein [unclassified Leifsonia]SEI02044.1 hypothetical protein SAMN04515694_11036 [Leifsonia sp. CL154]SFL70571.1 hypothetical protein SAMN04515692_11036 [Leifsonia sp. CL147]